MLKRIVTKQKKLEEKILPNAQENYVAFYNAATCAIVEIGEMLQEDTRWKTKVTGSKKVHYDRYKCLEEYCDVILYLINAGIFAGFKYDEVFQKLKTKQEYNFRRFIK